MALGNKHQARNTKRSPDAQGAEYTIPQDGMALHPGNSPKDPRKQQFE
jgi:hypothetical protein